MRRVSPRPVPDRIATHILAFGEHGGWHEGTTSYVESAQRRGRRRPAARVAYKNCADLLRWAAFFSRFASGTPSVSLIEVDGRAGRTFTSYGQARNQKAARRLRAVTGRADSVVAAGGSLRGFFHTTAGDPIDWRVEYVTNTVPDVAFAHYECRSTLRGPTSVHQPRTGRGGAIHAEGRLRPVGPGREARTSAATGG